MDAETKSIDFEDNTAIDFEDKPVNVQVMKDLGDPSSTPKSTPKKTKRKKVCATFIYRL